MRTAAILTSLAICLLAPTTAGAASVKVDQRCHRAAAGVGLTITGSGFAPQQPVEVRLAGSPVAAGESDASGDVRITIPVPAPPLRGPLRGERTYELSLVQGRTKATTRLRVALPLAEISPTSGSPRTVRVRFTAIGFGAGRKTMPNVYVHYLDPAGRHELTISLGRGSMPCGTIRRSASRRLFPFEARKGTWTLQFDTRRSYRRATAGSSFANVKIRLS